MTVWLGGLGIRCHTSFRLNWFNSSCIATSQSSSAKASVMFDGSTWDKNALWAQKFIEPLVFTPEFKSLVRLERGWELWCFQLLGLKGVSSSSGVTVSETVASGVASVSLEATVSSTVSVDAAVSVPLDCCLRLEATVCQTVVLLFQEHHFVR